MFCSHLSTLRVSRALEECSILPKGSSALVSLRIFLAITYSMFSR